uniref:Uncharacterized protein n=1 Tax=Quercus lobata TaxID=97700 RepID=A0A7N2LBJ5_QUELO
MLLNLICRTAVIGIVFLRYTMTDLARMDFLAIRRSLYYLFQIFLNVSLLWMHGETNEQWLAHKKAVAERERQLSVKKEVFWICCFLLTYIMLYCCQRSNEKKDGLKGGKKVQAGKIVQNEGTEDKPKDNSDPSSAAVVEDADGDEIKVVQAVHETKNTQRQAADAENLVSEVKRSEKKTVPKTVSKTVATKKQGDGNSSKTEIKADKDDRDDERKSGEKSGVVSKVETDADKKKVPQNDGKKGKLKDGDKSKDEKVRKDNDGKDDSRSKSNKDLKEKRA